MNPTLQMRKLKLREVTDFSPSGSSSALGPSKQCPFYFHVVVALATLE